jgi:hypothetical protein
MNKLLTYDEFLNESKKLNEAAPLTIDKYIKISKDMDDDYWVSVASKIITYMKLDPKAIFWITSEDDDRKFDQIESYWEDECSGDADNFDKQLDNQDGDGTWEFADFVPMFKYEESGISTYVLPKGLYQTLGRD